MAFSGLCGLTSLAAAAVGGVLGFLFGVPQTLSDASPRASIADQSGVTRYLRSNTNPEQVSDWLTKIVLGATLVEVSDVEMDEKSEPMAVVFLEFSLETIDM